MFTKTFLKQNCKAITVVFGNDYLLNTIVENLSQDLSVMSKYRVSPFKIKLDRRTWHI